MTGTTLDDYTDRYARRVRGMTASEIRALFAVASRPEVVSLAGGAAVHRRAAAGRGRRDARPARRRAGRHHPAVRHRPGHPRAARADLRGDGAVRHRRGRAARRRTTSSSRSGGQQALDLVARLFLDPGDVVLAEGPDLRRRARVVPGRPGAGRARADGRRRADPGGAREAPSPTWHGPAGGPSSSTRSRPTRTRPASPSPRSGGTQVLDICERAGLLVIEDDPYGQLSASTARRRCRCGPAAARASSTSARSPRPSRPGLRVGWILAPHAVRDKLVIAIEAQILCPSGFAQAAVTHVPDDHAVARAAQDLPRDLPGAARRAAGRARPT